MESRTHESPPIPNLASRIPADEELDGDAILGLYLDWTLDLGLELYAAQEDAVLELMASKHLVLATPTGSGKSFVSFLPAVSNKAANAIRATIRSWRLGATRNNQSLEEIAKFVNPYVRGWVNYYGRFYKSALTPVLRCLERSLVYWARRKFKRLRRHQRRAVHWLGRVALREPHLFEIWRIGLRPAGLHPLLGEVA